MNSTSPLTRRRFLVTTGLGAGALCILKDPRSARAYAANERLNVALVGVGGRGTWFVDQIPKMQNVVALCDVNERKLTEAFGRWEEGAQRLGNSPQQWERDTAAAFRRHLEARPKTFRDFRRMLEQMGQGLDAVIVATPDHTHAVAAAAAIRAGKHVFCEKPLTRSLHESRALRGLAREHKVATSMGNQGTASGPFRRALELIRDGTLGEIKEVHVWNTGGGADVAQPPGSEPAPAWLDWDLWLGPAAERPYHQLWMQRHRWREFGTSQLGNWASHTANLAFMALRIHELWAAPKPAPIRVEAQTSGLNRLSFPRWENVTWHIPARGDLPPVAFTWHNGHTAPGFRELVEPFTAGDKKSLEFAGVLIIGTRGRIHSTGHNATFRLLPENDFAAIERDRPQTVDASRGHEQDWFIACRGGKPAWANFDYASALNEFLMLGNVATQFESALEFDPGAMRVTNNAEADALLRPAYRKGWTL